MKKINFCLFSLPEKGKKIVWEMTGQCNMQCKHCCSDAILEKSFYKEFIFSTKNLIKERIDEMIDFGIKEFYISGGEPFFVKNILEILKYLKKKKAMVSIATNGYLLNRVLIKKLAEIKIDILHISLDGHSAWIHNSLRQGNFFKQTLDNIKKVLKNNIPLRIGCIIWRENENYLEDMVKFCISLGVKKLRFSWLIKAGRFKKNPQIFPNRKFNSVIQEIEEIKKKYKDLEISIHRSLLTEKRYYQNTKCPGGERMFFLDPEGHLSVCSWIAKNNTKFLTRKSIKDTGFNRLVKEKEIKEFKKLIKKRKINNCPFLD